MKKFLKFFLVLFTLCLTIGLVQSTDVSAASKIKLNKTKKTITAGESFTLKLSGASASKVTWKSSDTKIAKVSNGKVTGIAPGKAKITAAYKSKKYTCTVTVKGRLSADSTSVSCEDFVNQPKVTFTIADQKSTDRLSVKIADETIVYCEWVSAENNKYVLNFVPLENGKTTVTVSLNTDPVQSVKINVTCRAGSILSLMSDNYYVGALGMLMLDKILVDPGSAKINGVYAATYKGLEYIPMALIDVTSNTTSGSKSRNSFLFYFANEEMILETESRLFIDAVPYSDDDFFSEHHYVIFEGFNGSPSSNVIIGEELNAPLTGLFGLHLLRSAVYFHMYYDGDCIV